MRKVLSILGQLSDEDVEWIARQGQKMECPVGHILITAGQPVTHLFILLDGEVAVLLPNGTELVRVGSGEILGEMSLVDKSPPSASARITEKATFLSINQDVLRNKMDADPVFAAHMYRAIACFLSMRMRATISNLGYGKSGGSLDDEMEVDEEILDKLHLAGARFERMRQILG
jgi:CRP-like cAMP-binding protein